MIDNGLVYCHSKGIIYLLEVKDRVKHSSLNMRLEKIQFLPIVTQNPESIMKTFMLHKFEYLYSSKDILLPPL
jgi:hypothetical protein